MMKTHTHYFCNYTVGKDAYADVSEICSAYGRKIFLIHGEKSYAAAGEKLEKELRKGQGNGMPEIVDYALYGGDCTIDNIRKMAARATACGAEMIFGLGGGKALDTAKGAADLTGLPLFTFPTIASTCAATTALSVVYRNDGSFEKFLYYKRPARHCFIDLQVIAEAPDQYLRAGMGDTIGKYFECQFAARNDTLAHSSALGREISRLCWYPLKAHGAAALKACKENQVSMDLEEAVLANVVSTGLVSLNVLDEYNGAIAHSVYYALCLLPGFEQKFLHGDVVGYGVLVQLAIDHDQEQLKEVKQFLTELGIASTLREMDIPLERTLLEEVLKETIAGPDMEHIPYEVTKDMVYDAMEYVEGIVL